MEENTVKVFCRFRPLNESEERRSLNLCVKFLSPTTVEVPNESSDLKQFTFDEVFSPTTSQSEVYQKAALPIIESVMQGFNGTVFAYGQTSSGKTYTMTGGESEDSVSIGIIPRMINTVFEIINETPDYVEYSVKVAYCEIYLEKIKDLLDTTQVNLKIHEEKTRGVYIEGLTEHYVSCEEDVYELLKTGSENREVAYTKMNAGSSRSHSMFIVTVSQTNSRDYSGKVGKLYLVDLAGSEKVGKTGASGMRLEEAKNINKSLTVLGQVINTLTDGKSTHVPYRDSKLTRVLQEALGGNSKTSLIVTCSPSPYNESETVSSLRFGVRAKNIKNRAKVNREYTVAELKLLLSKSQEELERRAGVILKLEEKIRLTDQTLSDISFSFRNDCEKIDLDEVMAELEDYKQRLTVLCESNSNLKQENELLNEENMLVTNENAKLIQALTEFKEKFLTGQSELKEHENLIEKLVMTKENLENNIDALNKAKIELEKVVNMKNTEIHQLKQEMMFSVGNKGKQGSAGQEKNSYLSSNDEVTLLRDQVDKLESTYNSILKASYPDLIEKNKEFLEAKLKTEKEKWGGEKKDIMKDLENRIQRVIDLEIELDQLSSDYKYLQKNFGLNEKALIKKNEELEKYISQITSDYQREIRAKDKWKMEADYLNKKLIDEGGKIKKLEIEVEKIRESKEEAYKKVQELEQELNGALSKTKGRGNHIKKVVRGGVVIRTQSIAVTRMDLNN